MLLHMALFHSFFFKDALFTMPTLKAMKLKLTGQ